MADKRSAKELQLLNNNVKAQLKKLQKQRQEEQQSGSPTTPGGTAPAVFADPTANGSNGGGNKSPPSLPPSSGRTTTSLGGQRQDRRHNGGSTTIDADLINSSLPPAMAVSSHGSAWGMGPPTSSGASSSAAVSSSDNIGDTSGGGGTGTGGGRRAAKPSAGNSFEVLARKSMCPDAQQAKKSGGADDCTAASASKHMAIRRQPMDYLMVLDFEATCEENVHNYPHEIIEFPIVMIDCATAKVVAEFHSYVKPTRNPKLTKFCTQLTGIRQGQVDSAPTLPEVIDQFKLWAATAIPPDKKAVFATDGPWDLRDFMHKHSVVREKVEFPEIFYTYVNIRKTYADFFRVKPMGIKQMLARQGMSFEGSPHSGIDDSRNIARIATLLLEKGCVFSKKCTVEPTAAEKVRAAMEVELVDLIDRSNGLKKPSQQQQRGGRQQADRGGRGRAGGGTFPTQQERRPANDDDEAA